MPTNAAHWERRFVLKRLRIPKAPDAREAEASNGALEAKLPTDTRAATMPS